MKKENSLHNLIVSAFLVGLLFLLAINVRAAHGDPDYSFGSHGVKTDHVGSKYMYPAAIAQQADGKLLVGGRMTGTGYPFDLLLLRRYNTNGSVDTGFGLSGFGVEVLNGQLWYIYGEANSLTVQTDGKIVLAGGYYSFGSDEIKPAVFRFLSSGDLDTSFGDEGRVTFDEEDAGWPSGITFFKGRLLMIVTSSSGGRKLVRLNSDGDLDTGFGVSGMADIGIDSRTFTVNRVGGKIIVGGSVPDPDLIGQIPALQHFNMNGTPDTSHGSEGIALLSLNPEGTAFAANAIWSLDTQADGKIIAGNAYGSPGFGPYNSIVRLRSDDTLDPSFGSGGYAVESVSGETGPRVRVSRTLTQIMASGHGGTHSLKRYNSGGLHPLAFTVTYLTDFLIQLNDEKPVTLQAVNSGDIRLRRFLP